MERPKLRPSTIAYAVGAAAIIGYDWYCPKGEQISERFDEWMEHPLKSKIAAGAGLMVLAHLTNRFEKYGAEDYDPIHRVANLRNKERGGNEVDRPETS